MSHHLAAPAVPDRSSEAGSLTLPHKPPIAASVLLLFGGIAGLLQLLLPWFSAGKTSSSGWNQYYGTARSGAVETFSSYAIIIGVAAGLVMLVSAITLSTQRNDYTLPRRVAAIAAAAALFVGLWWLILGPTPDTTQFTAGWYLFLAAGVLGIAGVAVAWYWVDTPTVLACGGGLAALATLITPVFTTQDRALSGWQQYYGVAHATAGATLAAYGLLLAAAVGAIILLAAIGARLRAVKSTLAARIALIGGVIIVLAALMLLVTDSAPADATLTFGWYLLFLGGLVAIISGLAGDALGMPVGAARLLLVAAGVTGSMQFLMPWFDGASGWSMYYSQTHDGWSETSAAYVSLLSLIGGIAILVLALVTLVRPADLKGVARTVRRIGYGLIGVIVWFMVLGPVPFAAAIGDAGFGWYLLIITVALALSGAAIPLSSGHLTFDKVSFMAVFLGLPLAIFVLFVLSPFIQAFYYSMTDWKGFSKDMNFTGFHNYVKLFKDDQFRQAMLNSITLGIVVPLVTIILALAIASMVTVGGPSRGPVRGIKASSFYRVISFFPYAVPAIVIGIIWAQVYNSNQGILNSVLSLVGLDQFEGFAWLTTPSTAMPATMFVIIWSFVGFYAVLFIAAIKGVSAEVYEAARLDGAGRFRTAIGITVPLIRDTIQTAYIYLGIAALDAFVYVMALNPNGGPSGATLTMSQDLYLTAFKRQSQFGYGTAMGVVLAIVTLLFATLVFAVNRWAGRDKKAKVA